MKNLSVIIPTLDNIRQLGWCIHSLKKTDFDGEIFIVDNLGGIKLKEFIDACGIKANFLYPGQNVGWMAAINMALEYVDTKFVCMLNDDVCFAPQMDFWHNMLRHFADHKVAAVGPSSNHVIGAQCLFDVTLDPIMEVDFLAGFCMVTRTDLLKDMSGLDTDCLMGDDADLSIRFRQQELTLICDRECFLFHIGGQTISRVDSYQIDDYYEVTRSYLVEKHGVEWYERVVARPWETVGAEV
jgi:GT2 family glycosyltransferase